MEDVASTLAATAVVADILRVGRLVVDDGLVA